MPQAVIRRKSQDLIARARRSDLRQGRWTRTAQYGAGSSTNTAPSEKPAWLKKISGHANYTTFFASRYDLAVLARTFQTAFVVTLASLVFAYPIAYVAARRGGAVGGFLLGVVALSFWTSFLVRTYAWMVILGAKGPVVGL